MSASTSAVREVGFLSSGGGTTAGYFVEARFTGGGNPPICGHTVLTERWRHLSFEPGHPGVPNRTYPADAELHGLLSYEAAMALMAWTAADMGFAVHSTVDFRLVRVRLEYTHKLIEEGVGEPVNFFREDIEGRANFKPRLTPTDSEVTNHPSPERGEETKP